MLQLPRPSRSTLHCGLAALITVLLMTWVRPLGVLFLGLLSYWLYWTRCSFRIVLTPEVRSKLESWGTEGRRLAQEQPEHVLRGEHWLPCHLGRAGPHHIWVHGGADASSAVRTGLHQV
ncbi:GL13427 [Drosophila persimilis]|uniref:GL13427 n=1 Tax=Drosophila persimilis TaxID=7234 RepID=B4H2Z3_DROPE|nr:GL13427 [Drosophila persimilis]